jgi:predicted AAA+ superfamily ATPase
MDYIKRSLVRKINSLMKQFPAVVLIGARQTGKSVLLRQVLPKAKFFDLEDDSDFMLAENEPAVIFSDFKKPIIFDEAQLSKGLFRALRVEIDRDRSCGQFLLSGLSSPELLENISESLAGRVAIVEVPVFNFSESHSNELSFFTSSISSIDDLKKLKERCDLEQVFESCLFGGYPRPFLNRDNLDLLDGWFENYFKTYIERDVRALFPGLRLETFKKFIRMISRSSGEILNFSDFARSLDVSQPTIKKYFEIADGTCIWRTQNAFTNCSKKTVLKMPKGHFRDSGLLCYFLNINSVNDLKDHPQFGRIWESFVIEQILKMVHLNYAKSEFYYYRTKAQAEIDLVLEGRFGTVPIEIKSGINTSLKQIITIKKFVAENSCSLGIVINRGKEIKLLADKIIQIPVTYL